MSDELAFGADAPVGQIIRTTRAMRRLKPDDVPRELLEQLVQAAVYGPSGGNNQAFSFLILTDREQINRLVPIWEQLVAYYVSSQTRPDHMTEEAWQRLTATLKYQADNFADTPAVIVACYELSGAIERMKRTARQQWAALGVLGPRKTLTLVRNLPRTLFVGEAASIYPGVQNLLLTARSLGLGATMTTWHTIAEQEIKRVLGIPRKTHIYAIIPVGWPTGKFGPVSRRSVADDIHWQRW